ncbi:MAG TPA: DUF2231 domain-containing protein [Terriglobia bacterium]|nr:DUF2231 domain-containing protein [Terriglobia bacterium]
MNPFDLKCALLAKHAQHVVVIHFPIALFTASVFFDLLARWRRDKALATASYYNLVAGAVAALPALATGLIAWQWLLEGEKLKGNLLLHLILGLTSAGLIWLLAWWRTRQRRRTEERLTIPYLTVELLAVVMIALTGHLGGILSGVEISP